MNDGTGNLVISDFLRIEPSKPTGKAGQPMSFAVAICSFTVNNDPVRNSMNMLANRGDLLNSVYDDKQPQITLAADCPDMKQRGTLQVRGPTERIKVTATERIGVACQYSPRPAGGGRWMIVWLLACAALLRRGRRLSTRWR